MTQTPNSQTRKSSFRFRSALLATASLLVLAGCRGPDTDPEAASARSSTAPTASETTAAAALADEASGPPQLEPTDETAHTAQAPIADDARLVTVGGGNHGDRVCSGPWRIRCRRGLIERTDRRCGAAPERRYHASRDCRGNPVGRRNRCNRLGQRRNRRGCGSVGPGRVFGTFPSMKSQISKMRCVVLRRWGCCLAAQTRRLGWSLQPTPRSSTSHAR
jgi:hypothetical protein